MVSKSFSTQPTKQEKSEKDENKFQPRFGIVFSDDDNSNNSNNDEGLIIVDDDDITSDGDDAIKTDDVIDRNKVEIAGWKPMAVIRQGQIK